MKKILITLGIIIVSIVAAVVVIGFVTVFCIVKKCKKQGVFDEFVMPDG